MSGRDDDSFERKLRVIVSELSQSAERFVKGIDLDEIALQVELGGERVREVADFTARWIGDRLSDPVAPNPDGDRDVASDAPAPALPRTGPHPLDVPTDEQGRALSALDSGRWSVKPGTDELVDVSRGEPATDNQSLVGELRGRDWIAASGEVTFIGREALKRWIEASSETDDVT